jgi:hypothetical protein
MSPIAPEEWWTYQPSYTVPTASSPASYKIPWITVQTTDPNRAVITLGTPSTTPASYTGEIALSIGSFASPDYTFTSTSGYHVREDLLPGRSYKVRARAHSGANGTGQYGEYIYYNFTMPAVASVAAVSETVSPSNSANGSTSTNSANNSTYSNDAQDDAGTTLQTGSSTATSGIRTITRSLLTIDSQTKEKSDISVISKNIGIPTTYSHYSFGAGFFFNSVTKNPVSAGGIGFFTSDNGMTGYFIEIQTDSSFKDVRDQSVTVYKVVNGSKKKLPDSQSGENAKLYGGVIHSTSYKLDIKVERTSAATIIDLYINNFKISAVDQYSSASTAGPLEKAIPVTSDMSLFASLYKISFDYIYAVPLSPEQYKTGIVSDIYTGHYGSTMLSFAYGEKLINNAGTPALKNAYIEEFGTVARELRRVKVNYAQTAGIPRYATVGVNKFADVLGSKFSNHGAEVFVVNNAGTFIPLQAGANNFYIVGDFVSITGQHEYTETTVNEFTTLEPATFDSTWIQSESDAKALFEWIKTQWSKQQSSISMEVFGNPALEPGDVITINYPSNGLDGTQKFLVTSISNEFDGGLSTTITARSIYS